MLKKAYEKMDSLEDGAYFDLIRRLLRECASLWTEKSVFPKRPEEISRGFERRSENRRGAGRFPASGGKRGH